MEQKSLMVSILTLSVTALGCIEPYSPPSVQANLNYLVVDGFLNATDSTCHVTLSRTVTLNNDSIVPEEKGALIQLIDEGGNVTSLSEEAKGNYSASHLYVDKNKKYSLKITTSNSFEYRSVLVPVSQTPAIDSVTWRNVKNGVAISVNTHDPENDAKYYYWKFTETWAYHTPYITDFTAENHQVYFRSERINNCWGVENSTTINVSSSSKLEHDIIDHFKLTTIPFNSKKLQSKYSIEVEQRAISLQAFDYLQALKKNTENLGSIFDPLPSNISGNLRCISKPDENVLGYFNAGTVEKKRIFIKNREVNRPKGVSAITGYEDCHVDTVMNYWPGRGEYIVGIIYQQRIIVVGFVLASPFCADCRLLGGTIARPDFWE